MFGEKKEGAFASLNNKMYPAARHRRERGQILGYISSSSLYAFTVD